MPELVRSDNPAFWQKRFESEGAIWGEGPSVTAMRAVHSLSAGARVLEIGFGYGRDLAFLIHNNFHVWGIDFCPEAHLKTEANLRRQGLAAERLLMAPFEACDCPDAAFDAVLSHRMAHLLVTDDAVDRFVNQAQRVLRPRGLLCLGVRNSQDINPGEVRLVRDNVYEYLVRPGHWIRFWDDDQLRKAFAKAFDLQALEHVCEQESLSHPVPCHLTVMIAKRIL